MSLTLREEHRLKMSENRVLRRIFRPKREKVAGGWRRLHNEELHDLYVSRNIIRVIKSRKMRWSGHVARMGERRYAHKISVGKAGGRRPLRRTGRKYEDNIKMDLRKIGWEGVKWKHLAQDRDQWWVSVVTVTNLLGSIGDGEFLNGLNDYSLFKRTPLKEVG
jgi:hypothetical protein